MTPNRDETRAAVAEHLTGLHSILWGQFFDIVQRPDDAIDWATDLVMAIDSLRTKRKPPSTAQPTTPRRRSARRA